MVDKSEKKGNAQDGGISDGYSFLKRKRSASVNGLEPDSSGSNRDRESGGTSEPSGEGSASGSIGSESGSTNNTERIDETPGGIADGNSGIGGDDRKPSASDGSGSGGIGGSGGEKLRSGRHSRACSCIRCRDRRSKRGETEPEIYTDDGSETGYQKRTERARQDIPREVDFDSIFGGSGSGQKIRVDDLLAWSFVMLFKFPKFAGYGEHWELSKDESKQLGSTLKQCLETIPEEKKRKVMKRVENFAPWVALVAFGGIMVYGRVIITQEMMRTDRHKRVYNIKDAEVPVTSAPVAMEDLNAETANNQNAKGYSGKQPGATFSGGKDLPLPFRIPE